MKSCLGKAAWLLFGTCAAVFMIAPALVIALYSFSRSRYFRFPTTQFSLEWYGHFFASAAFQQAMLNTAILAITVTPACLLVALCTAHALARAQFKGKGAIDAIEIGRASCRERV